MFDRDTRFVSNNQNATKIWRPSVNQFDKFTEWTLIEFNEYFVQFSVLGVSRTKACIWLFMKQVHSESIKINFYEWGNNLVTKFKTIFDQPAKLHLIFEENDQINKQFKIFIYSRLTSLRQRFQKLGSIETFYLRNEFSLKSIKRKNEFIIFNTRNVEQVNRILHCAANLLHITNSSI